MAELMIESKVETSSWHPCLGRLPVCSCVRSLFASVYSDSLKVIMAEKILYKLMRRAIGR